MYPWSASYLAASMSFLINNEYSGLGPTTGITSLFNYFPRKPGGNEYWSTEGGKYV